MKTVIGLFDDFTAAQAAVQSLVTRGFDRADISIVANQSGADSMGATGDASQGETTQSEDRKQAMQEGAKTGAGTGAVIGTGVGGVLGLLVGLGTIFIPGVGPIIAAGPLIATITGAGVGAAAGAAVGGLVGALTRVGVPEHDAHFYAESVRRGGSLVVVRAEDDKLDDIADILSEHGAADVDKRRDYFAQTGFTAHDTAAQPYTAEQIAQERLAYRQSSTTQTAGARVDVSRNAGQRTGVVDEAQVTVPVVEEELHVGKRLVERGGVRVYTQVTETPVQEQVTLQEQRATVTRKTVDRPVGAADATAFKEQTFEVREFAEQAVVAKEARVVEEVTVGRKLEERTEVISDTVRRTDVQVEEVDVVKDSNPATRVPPPPNKNKAS